MAGRAGSGGFAEYRETVGERLRDRGYDEIGDGPPEYDAVAYHRRTRSVLPPGVVDRVVVLAGFGAPAARAVEEFSARTLAFARSHGATRSPWLGGITAAFPVAACDEPELDAKRWVAGHMPAHRRAYEFPVVADLVDETVHYPTETPLLGKSSYESFRETAAEVFDPSTSDLDSLEL